MEYCTRFFSWAWGAILFFFLSCILYERGVHHIAQDYRQLSETLQNLELNKVKGLAEQAQLQLQIKSEADPAWVELVLMQDLGVVPEAQIKILFTSRE